MGAVVPRIFPKYSVTSPHTVAEPSPRLTEEFRYPRRSEHESACAAVAPTASAPEQVVGESNLLTQPLGVGRASVASEGVEVALVGVGEGVQAFLGLLGFPWVPSAGLRAGSPVVEGDLSI